MNLNQSPTLEQLKALFEPLDHLQAHHTLWVSSDGEVQISVGAWDNAAPPLVNARIRYETFSQGTDNVGPDAANDSNRMNEILNSLQEQWRNAGPGTDPIYVDQF